MRVIRPLGAALSMFLLLIAAVASDAADRRPITEQDILEFKWIGDAQVSSDGTQVVFVRVVVNEDKDRYETSHFVVPTNGGAEARPFMSGPFDASPRWSPDGKTIAFVRAIEKDGKPGKKIHGWIQKPPGFDPASPPGNGGEQMFRALKYLEIPVVMARFPDETHELSRSGKPSHRIERLRHIVAWFDK